MITEPLLNGSIDLSAVACSTWDTTTEGKSQDLARHRHEAASLCTIVVNLPERVTAKETRELMSELKSQLTVDQPYVVLDLSEVKQIDTAGVDLLLECLVETARRDGNVRLRGISPEAATVLELTGMDLVLQVRPEVVGTESELDNLRALRQEQTQESFAA